VRGLGETVEKQMVGVKTMNHHLLLNGNRGQSIWNLFILFLGLGKSVLKKYCHCKGYIDDPSI
jgi:hypothetical protein